MAENLLNALIERAVDHERIINGIKDGSDSSSILPPRNPGEEFSLITEFVPCFLNFVKSKLSKNLSEQQLASCSPKRSTSFSRTGGRSATNSRANLTSCFDNQDVKRKSKNADSRSKSFDSYAAHKSKPNMRNSSERRANSSKKQKRIDLNVNKSCIPIGSPQLKPAFGSSMNGGLNGSPFTSTPQTNKPNQRRRITPTMVTPDNSCLQENETQSLFESSPVLESSESSLDSSGSSCSMTRFGKKIKSLEKSMRSRRRNERNKIPLAAFLSIEETKDSQKNFKMSPFDPPDPAIPEVSKGLECLSVSESSGLLCSAPSNKVSDTQESNQKDDETFFSIKCISDKEQLDGFIEIYKCILLENLISNICIELYFLFSVLNCKIDKRVSDEVDEVIFESVESCIYFATKVLDGTKELAALFDRGTLLQIRQSRRLQNFAPDLIELVNNKLSDFGTPSNSSTQPLNLSLSVGVPFLAEGNNRKAFVTDRHFYSFSKMRDKFYGLIRTWEENQLNQDWNIERELGERFQSFFFEFSEFPTYAQFSQLFIAQLIETSLQDLSGIGNREGSTSTSLLRYLKSSNPAKLQRLQERFFSPMISHGPCPKPYFTDADNFFKFFIKKTCNYFFLVHLKDALISRLLDINKHDFQSHLENDQVVDDENEELSHMRNEFSAHLTEAKLLAKFLGMIVFSPYDEDSRSKNQTDELGKQEVNIQPFDPGLILSQAKQSGRLIITIPWLVTYLSMMDELSLRLQVNLPTFQFLASLYRAPYFKFKKEGITLNRLFVLVQLGWLFEQPLVSSIVPFYQILADKSIDYEQPAEELTQLDYIKIISKSVLIRFCPYLSEIKSVFSNTGIGTIRKITPLTHVEKLPVIDVQQQLKEKMIQDFFKYKPKHFKESTDFITDRFFNNMKIKATTDFIPSAVRNAVTSLEKNLLVEEDSIVEIGDLKSKNAPYLKHMMSSAKADLVKSFSLYCDEFCMVNTCDVISKVLPDDIHKKVIDTAAKIVSNDVRQKLNEWIEHKMMETFEKELNAAYSRLLMNELKRHNKSLNESDPI